MTKGFNRHSNFSGFRRFLLIQLGDIGDAVLTIPVINLLKEQIPDATITIVLREKARGLMELCPAIDQIFYVNTSSNGFKNRIKSQYLLFKQIRQSKPDVAVDFRTGDRGAVIAFMSGAKLRLGRRTGGWEWRNALFTDLVFPDPSLELGQYAAEHHLNIVSSFGIAGTLNPPFLEVSNEQKRRAYDLLKKEGLDSPRAIAFAPFSLWPYKELKPKILKEVIGYVAFEISQVLLLGSWQDRTKASAISDCFDRGKVMNLVGKTSLGDLPGIISLCKLLVGVDSAALHIAAAVGTPTLGIFGPSSTITWAPKGPSHSTIKKSWPCVPCRQKGCQGTGISRCLEEMEKDEIIHAIDSHLIFLEKAGMRTPLSNDQTDFGFSQS